MTHLSFHGLVNRKRVMTTLEDKANITGYRWTRPRNIPQGFVEKRSQNGDLLHYSHTELVTIQDVDGREKRTTRTSFFDVNKQPKHAPAPFHGEWIEGLAGKYHGTLSRNWKQETLTLREIIDVLNAGYAFAPGFFKAPPGESHRSADYCEHRTLILFDGDEWTEEHAPPDDLDDLLNRYPNLSEDFYWIGESISSRSCLKPELRTRLMLVLPKPIYKGQEALWETVIDALVEKYPFIARGVGIDKVRLSFGNARPESENRVLGGMISEVAFRQWETTAAEKEAHRQRQEQEKTEWREQRGRARAAEDTVRSELEHRGYQPQTLIDPLVAFCECDAGRLLQEVGATHLHGETWNWHESGPGRSFELKDGIIKPFSNSMQVASPEVDGTKPINAHRFLLYYQYHLDLTKDRDKHELRCQLSDAGYGTHPDVYRDAKAAEREAAIREGLISPETHRNLQVDTDFQRETSALEAERISIESGLAAWLEETEGKTGQVLNITTAAGTGKSTTTITTPSQLLYIAKTTEEADQAFSVAKDLRHDVHRHRPRRFNRRHQNWDTLPIGLGENERPCVYPEACNALATAGHSTQVKCDGCAWRVVCESDGYLSQAQIERSKKQVFYAWDESLFSDRVHRERVQRLTEGGKLLVCDEAVPSNLPMSRWVSISELAVLLERWRFIEQKDLYLFLKKLNGELANATTSADFFDAVLPVANLPEDRFQEWNTLLERLPIACILKDNGVASVEWDSKVTREVEATRVFDEETPLEKHRVYWQYVSLWTLIELRLTDFSSIPKVYPNLLLDLRDFLETSRRDVAPCLREQDVWRFYLPPGLNADRGIILSASDAADHVSRVYKGTDIGVTTLTGKPPKWQSGCQLYQISTGRYSLWQGLLNKKKNFKPQARRMVNLIHHTAEQGIESLVVAPITFIQSEGTKKLREHPNITLINHHHAEGRNDYQNCEMVFVFHYEPRPDVIEAQVKRIYRNACDLSFERETIDIVKDGVSLKRERYTDRRVQSVFDRECQARLMQSILRLRQMVNSDKIAVVFSSEPIGGLPIAPIPFTLKDAELCFAEGGNWDGLEAFLAETDVQKVAARDGVSERTARRKTKSTRDAEDHEKKQQALRLRVLGKNLRDAGEAVGVSHATVRRWEKMAKLDV